MDHLIVLDIAGETLIFLAERALYWPGQKALIIADFHAGKTAHFRKNGIAANKGVADNDYLRLSRLIAQYSPERLIILGDLFHSVHNNEWQDWQAFRSEYPEVQFELVPGNHDILSTEDYQRAGMVILDEIHSMSPFVLIHEYDENIDAIQLSGHVHPAVRLNGAGRQAMRLPCFYIRPFGIVLPAFSQFTGSFTVKPKKGDRVLVITPKGIFEPQNERI